ncbi:caspase family protein [Candidatus Pelagibacter sp.]|nr:caspase family protein [Candidatus Pelagibacter sp.]
MKRLLTYLFIVLGLGLTFNVNANLKEVSISLNEKCKSFDKYDINWYSNKCGQQSSLKSAIKINKKEKVEYLSSNNTAYWDFMQFKMNDLRGDGIVYYIFDVDKYYRINKNYEVVSKGSYKFKKNKKIYELTTQNNQKFLLKISISSQVIDIKSKFYNYKGYRRYQLLLADTNEQEQIRSSLKNFENNKYVKVDSNQNNPKNVSLKSALDINKKDKVDFDIYKHGGSFFWGYSLLIDDLRGNGPVYYKFNIDEYHRLDKNFNVLSRGKLREKKKKGYWLFELEEDNTIFQWKISVVDKIVDIKSSFYDYKGFKRYHIKETSKEQKKLVSKSIIYFGKNEYAKVDSNKDNDLKSGIEINKDKKIKYLKFGGQDGYDLGYFYMRAHKIDDLRGDGVVYYKFDVMTGNAGLYYRLDKDHEVISKGNFQYQKKKKAFELKEDNKTFLWKVSMANEIVDINSKLYDYKGYRRYQYLEADENTQNKIYTSIKNYEDDKYVQVGSKKNNKSSMGYEIAIKYDDSDDNLNRLWKLILRDKDIEKRYLKYSNKKATFKGKPIRAMGLAVFIDYKKELSILTKDIYTKEISSPIAWGWEYSYKDPAKIKGFAKNKTVVDGFEAIRNCYKEVRKKKLSLRDGECILVDVRRIVGQENMADQYPVIWYNYLIETKKNRILLAKESEKSNQQIAYEIKKKKVDQKKKQELLLAQKKAGEETKKLELLLAQKKIEEEKRKKELLQAQEKEDQKKKQKLLLAQKIAEEETKKQELLLAQKKAEEETKRQELLLVQKKEEKGKKQEELIAKLKEQEQKKLSELELAKKEAEKEFEKKKKKLNIDKDSPEIIVAETITVSSQVYKLKGKVKDKSDFFLEVDGQPVKVNKDGEFLFEGFIINTNEGEELIIVAVDRWNNSTEKSVKINVELKEMKVAKGYEKLLPNKISVKKDKNKIAIIIGVEKYENLTNLDAAFANRDANAFREYAVRALGIDPSNINLLVDKDASRPKILKALKLWLPKIGGENRDIYLFFAGHGLASDDGKNLYILPEDGDANLLEDTAITRNEIIKILQKTNPKSVTMFFDTCYSGQTRNEETLVASLRPVRIVADDQAIPNNFTIFTASANDQTSGSIEEAKHGMFSYYLMKGMEGAADENEDNKISNGELIAYIQNNVSKVAFSQNREQDPGMSGDKDKILFTYK